MNAGDLLIRYFWNMWSRSQVPSILNCNDPFRMKLESLLIYKYYTKMFTENDRTRFKNLLSGEFDTLINYMLEKECKLKQETIEQ